MRLIEPRGLAPNSTQPCSPGSRVAVVSATAYSITRRSTYDAGGGALVVGEHLRAEHLARERAAVERALDHRDLVARRPGSRRRA